MIDWLRENAAWLCVAWLLGGWLLAWAFVRVPRPKVLPPKRPFLKPPRAFESEGDYYRRLYQQELERSIDRSMTLGCRIYELETENKRLAFRLRCAECLISARALRGDVELDATAADNGMGC